VRNEVPIGLAGSSVVPDEALADVAAPFHTLATRKAAGRSGESASRLR
jgi:hypothetical protein